MILFAENLFKKKPNYSVIFVSVCVLLIKLQIVILTLNSYYSFEKSCL